MTTQMKARDIIPGWPRGKSTTQPTIPPLTWWELHDGRLYEMVEVFHAGSDRHYHAGQQAMADLWRDNEAIERAYKARSPKPPIWLEESWASFRNYV